MTATTVAGDRTMSDLEYEAWAAEVRQLAEERGAVVLAHNYQVPEIQDVAHFTGDSLYLSRVAAETDAREIVFCGVHFMAETAKILSPDKTVLLPDHAAGCSLADSITAEQLREWKAEHPGAVVVSYVNTTAAVKAETDICCTIVQRRRRHPVHPGRPRDPVLPRPVPRRARQAGHRPGEHLHLGGGVPRARRDQPQRRPGADRRPPGRGDPGCTPSAAARPRCWTWSATATCRPTAPWCCPPAAWSRPPRPPGPRRCWWPPRSASCTSCGGSTPPAPTSSR